MAYQRPIVLIYQEYAKLTTATQTTQLLPCVIGPCYHIVDIDDELLAYAGELSAIGLSGAEYPSNKPGAIVDLDSPQVLVKDVLCRITAGISVLSADKNIMTFNPDAFPDEVAVGDYVDVYMESTYYAQDARVIEVRPDSYEIVINRYIGSAILSAMVDFNRKVNDLTFQSSDSEYVLFQDDTFTVGSLSELINDEPRPVIEGKVYIGYRALRQDLSDIGTLYSVDEITANCGKIAPENPLAYGVSIALANTTTGVMYVGVDSDDLVGYTATADRLEDNDDVYAIVPLTQNPAILAMFKSHASQLSLPDRGKRRAVLGSTPLITETELCSGSAVIIDDTPGETELPG